MGGWDDTGDTLGSQFCPHNGTLEQGFSPHKAPVRPPWQLGCCRLLQLKGKLQVTEHTAYLSMTIYSEYMSEEKCQLTGILFNSCLIQNIEPTCVFCAFSVFNVYYYSEHSLNILYTFERLLLRTEFQMFGIKIKK